MSDVKATNRKKIRDDVWQTHRQTGLQ